MEPFVIGLGVFFKKKALNIYNLQEFVKNYYGLYPDSLSGD